MKPVVEIKDITYTECETTNAGVLYTYPSGCTFICKDLSEHDFKRVFDILSVFKTSIEAGTFDGVEVWRTVNTPDQSC